jgi:ATP-dependent RNA helicase RhlE
VLVTSFNKRRSSLRRWLAQTAHAQSGECQTQQGSRNNRNAVPSSRPARPAKSEAPRGRSRNAAPARDEDPGLMLISRRPPQQKFTNFEEYMTAHGGATAPIEDHTDET